MTDPKTPPTDAGLPPREIRRLDLDYGTVIVEVRKRSDLKKPTEVRR
jgi:hypothetical protein